MPSEYQHETLQAALIAGGYADAAAKVAAVAAQRGLGARTTVSLITKIDPQAAQIAEDILGDDHGPQAPTVAQTPEQNQATAERWLDEGIRNALGFGQVGGEQ
jgi:hypothetical protein